MLSAMYISNFPKVRGLIAANTYDQLNRSTLLRIREVWQHEAGIKEYNEYTGQGCYVVGIQPPKHFNTDTHNFDRYDNIISFDNGAVVYIGSLDNYKALDGMEVAWAMLDETKDTKEEAIKEVIIGRMRQKGIFINSSGELVEYSDKIGALTPFTPLYIFSSPAKVQWINEWFGLDDFEKEILAKIYSETDYFSASVGNKFVTISSTYHNVDNLPVTYIPNQKANLHQALQDMLIYGNPFAKSGGEFYKCFNRTLHVVKSAYDKALCLHVTFDFNVNPYVTCLIHQIVGKTCTQIDEICLPTPNNRTTDACKELIRRYKGHVGGMRIYGDPSGDHEDTRSEKGSNDFTIIRSELKEFNATICKDEKAPPVVMRGNFINTVFEKNYAGLKFLIGDRCKNTIADYTYGKEASDGTKLKEKIKDRITLVTYEKFHHCSDANDYFYCYAFRGEFILYQRGGIHTVPLTGGNVSKNRY